MSIDLNRMVAQKPRFAARKVGEEMVLVPMKGSVADMSEMFTLNEVGCIVWENLNEGATPESLLEAVVDNFDVDRATAKADLDAFLAELEQLLHD